MMELKKFAPIYGLLLGLGIIFSTFQELALGGVFGFDWFLKMLWFVIGFPVLFAIGQLFYALATTGEAKILSEEE